MRLDIAYQRLRGPLEPDCERAQALISRHIDRELDAAGARQLKAHLDACPACRRMLEVQSEQARELTQSLAGLWPQTNSVKKKWADGRLAWALTRLGGPCGVAFAAALAWAIFVESNANAPAGKADAEPPDGTRPVSKGAPPSSANLPAVDLHALPACNSSRADLDGDDIDAVLSGEFDVPEELRAAPKPPELPARFKTLHAERLAAPALPFIDNDDDLPRAIFCARELTPATVDTLESGARTYSALGEKTEAAPLRGVAMAYSLIRNNGARETGRVLLLGDVAHQRGRLRLETDGGERIESAQTEWEAAFSPERRAVVRNFLNMCADPRFKAELEARCKP
jgi:hypothetical protein